MKHTSQPLSGRNFHAALRCHRLNLEILEERLPPGDGLLGFVFGSFWLGSSQLPIEPGLWVSGGVNTQAPSESRREIQRGNWSTLNGDNLDFAYTRPAGRFLLRAEQTESTVLGAPASTQRFSAENNGGSAGSFASPAFAQDNAFALPGFDWYRGTAAKAPSISAAAGAAASAASGNGGSGMGSTGTAKNELAGGASVPQAATVGTAASANPTTGDMIYQLVSSRTAVPGSSLNSTELVDNGPAAPVAPHRDTAAVHALFDLDTTQGGPFPANRFTVADHTQNTGRRVNLPLPDPTTHPSDYEDVNVLNTLDGFNLQPRLSIPFDGPIDVNTVNSNTVFLVSMGDTLDRQDHGGQVVGINQVVWDPATNTLHVESDAVLDQHTRYTLIVTDGVHDSSGAAVGATDAFRHFRRDLAHSDDPVLRYYRKELIDAMKDAKELGIKERDIVAASVFTTESATAVLEKIRDQIHAATPAPAEFNLGPDSSRTVFSLNTLTAITFNEQVGDNPDRFNPVNVNLALARNIPGAVGEIAFGKYQSPDYEVHPGEYIPAVATRTGTPVVQSVNDIYFNLFLPAGPEPAGGWPVAIFGLGTGNDKNQTPLFLAATLADQGIATISINAVGHGFGPLSTLTVRQTGADPVTFSAGGRAIDQNGDHVFANPEGSDAAAPTTIVRDTDGFRQTDADLMQLVRAIEVGMDVHGSGSRDLDPSRIYYLGYSRGAVYGTPFLAVEPDVQAGVLNGGGGSRVDQLRLSVGFRNTVGAALAARTPSLLNSPGVTSIDGVPYSGPFFDENLPLRDSVPLSVGLSDGTSRVIQSPVINSVPGATAIQEVLDNTEWVSQSANPVAYAPHLRQAPLPGVPAKSVIIQFAKGDLIDPNPMTTAMLRAGDLADHATYFRNDLAFAEDPTVGKNPHQFMLHAELPGLAGEIASGAQEQIATFFATDGQVVIQPEPARFFEVPIAGPLPEDLNFIA